ncbi:MAG: hypothetical protein Kow0042_04010 [Calditrichia bacterium]
MNTQSDKIVTFLLFMTLLITNALFSTDYDKIKLEGAFLGAFNILNSEYRTGPDPYRRQFDFGANLDASWQLHHRIHGNIQLQMGSGGGSLGLAEEKIVVTDLNVEFRFSNKYLLTVGSFDTPIGADTPHLSNNADISQNALILNSLFYGAFAGTDMGTLNTPGIKGQVELTPGHLVLSITNGTDESAFNPDGNFGLVVAAETKPFFDRLKFAGSLIYSYDAFQLDSLAVGSGAKLQGWLIDGIYESGKSGGLRAYYGVLTYDDRISATEDDVQIWKLEGKLSRGRMSIAGRISGWIPDDHNRDSQGLSAAIPLPGYTRPVGQNAPETILPVSDQEVRRYQFAAEVLLSEAVDVIAEFFWDDYQQETGGITFDVRGLIAAINVRF